MRRDMKIAFGCIYTSSYCPPLWLTPFRSALWLAFLGWPYAWVFFQFSLRFFFFFFCGIYRPLFAWLLLSIYAFHREIGLNAYVKDPIKVAQSRTPCVTSIYTNIHTYISHCGTYAPVPVECWPSPQIRFSNPISFPYLPLGSASKTLSHSGKQKKIPFSIWQFLAQVVLFSWGRGTGGRCILAGILSSHRDGQRPSHRTWPFLRLIISNVFNLSCLEANILLEQRAIVRLSRSNFYYDSNTTKERKKYIKQEEEEGNI